MVEENTLLSANFIHAVPDESSPELNLQDNQKSSLVGVLQSRFEEARRAREVKERIWLDAYQNYRGVYGKNVKFNAHEKSKVFVKVTKTKVLAAYGMVIDVIFGDTKFPLGVKETDVPEGAAERAHLNTAGPAPTEEKDESEVENPFDPGYVGDGKVLAPGATFRSATKFLQDSTEKFKEAEEADILIEGPATDPSTPQISPAKESAIRMQKLIHDQLEETNADIELRNAFFEMCLLGTGIIKGPYNYNKTLHNWAEDEEGNRAYQPVEVRVPRIEFVSCWDVYPDAHSTSIADSDYLFQRRRFTRSDIRGLLKLPYFNKEAIRDCLDDGPNYVVQDFETLIRIDDSAMTGNLYASRYEILEYWGTMDAEFAREIGIDVPKSVDALDEVQANIWLCGDHVLRGVVNPFIPNRLPYFAVAYETNPYSFWGVGVAENMEDSQAVMNGHARMAIDNLALSGSVVFDIDETALVAGQSMSIYPGKVFRRQAGGPGQSIFAIKFPNTSQENLAMFDKFRQLADESTGIPSFSHGQTGVQSTTRTASGMSMLLGAASLAIKTVVKNIDDALLKPLGDAYFQWNNQFFDGVLGIKGDLEVKALGTSSLLQKEVRSQRITAFLQTAANPAVAPLVKMPTLIKEFARTLDLDPEEILNSPEEAAISAALIGAQNGANQAGGPQAGAAGQEQASLGAPQGALTQGETTGASAVGDGQILPGGVQPPSGSSFSG